MTSPQQMRQVNALHILQRLRRSGPLGRTDIARTTGLSKPTVNAIVAELLARDYLLEEPPEEGAQRRPGPSSNILRFNSRIGCVIGYDLSISRLRVGLADLGGRLLEVRETRFEAGLPTLDGFAALALQQAEDLSRAHGVDRDRLWGVGVGLPGFVDRATGEIRLASGFEPWHGRSFEALLASGFLERFDCPFVAGGRVQFSMSAEKRYGLARGLENAIFAYLGKGIGLGIMANGEVLQGADGFAGEIGCMPVEAGEPAPPGIGAFEWMAGGHAYARLARQAVERGESPVLAALCEGDPTRLDARLVFEAARRGDAAAQAIVDRLTERLARGLAAAVCIFNPSKLVVGAGLTLAGEAFVKDLGARVAALVPFPVEVERTALGDTTCVLGAVEHAIRRVERDDFHLYAPRARSPA